jgi:hypothetical protein
MELGISTIEIIHKNNFLPTVSMLPNRRNIRPLNLELRFHFRALCKIVLRE